MIAGLLRLRLGRFCTTVLVVSLIAAPAAAVVEQDAPRAAPDPQQDSAEGDRDEPRPVATERDSVLVEARLPYIPTANTIATKLPTELSATPSNVGVVGGELIEEQRALVLGDALRNISGLNVQTGVGVFDFFVVRGFDSLNSGLVLVDGAPEPEVTFYQLYNADRVELLKGPSGFLYGPNPLAGAVNIVRKQPLQSDFGSISLHGGSFGTFEGTVDLNRAAAGAAAGFRLNGLWRETDGYRDGRRGEVRGLNPAFFWRPGDRSSLNLNFELLSSDYVPDAGLPLLNGELPEVPRTRSYASPFDRSEQELTRFQIDFEHRFGSALTVRNKTYFRQLDWLSDGTLFGPVLPGAGGEPQVTRSLLLLDDRQRFFGNQLEAVWRVATGRLEHRLLAGVEVARFEDRFTLDVALLPPIDLLRPEERAGEPLFLVPGQSAAGDSRSQTVAPYLIDDIAISPRLRALVGMRYDEIDYDDPVAGVSRTDGELSPLLGAVVETRPGLSLYASLARSFAPPSPRAAGDRQPETSRQVEIGARRELLADRLRLTLAVFELRRDNIAIPDDNGFTQQVGDQRARGAELELALELPDGWRGLLVYGYTESELTEFAERVLISIDPPQAVTIDRSGNQAAFAPRHLASLWLSRRLSSRLTLAGGLRYVGKQFLAEDNEIELDDYLLADLAFFCDVRQWRLSLHLRNVTDTDYETRGFGSASVIPGAPLSADFGVHYRF